jgi:hypothetical protein
VLCLIVVPLLPGKNPFSVYINNNNKDNKKPSSGIVTCRFLHSYKLHMMICLKFKVIRYAEGTNNCFLSENIIFLGSMNSDGGKAKTVNRYKFYQKMHCENLKWIIVKGQKTVPKNCTWASNKNISL